MGGMSSALTKGIKPGPLISAGSTSRMKTGHKRAHHTDTLYPAQPKLRRRTEESDRLPPSSLPLSRNSTIHENRARPSFYSKLR